MGVLHWPEPDWETAGFAERSVKWRKGRLNRVELKTAIRENQSDVYTSLSSNYAVNEHLSKDSASY